MLNRVILIGRLVRDPEMRITQGGIVFTRFTLAVDRPYKNQAGEKETDFIDVIAWRKLGELCAEYLAKGKLVAIDGRIEIQNYEDKEGQKRKYTQIVAENARFLSPRQGGKKPEELKDLDIDGVASVVEVNEDELPF